MTFINWDISKNPVVSDNFANFEIDVNLMDANSVSWILMTRVSTSSPDTQLTITPFLFVKDVIVMWENIFNPYIIVS